MSSDFMRQFLAGWGMGQQKLQNQRQAEQESYNRQQDALRQQQEAEDRAIRMETFKMQQQEAKLKLKQEQIAAAQQEAAMKREAAARQMMPAPTAQDVGIQQTTPQDVGPTMDQIQVNRPTDMMPSPTGGSDIPMPMVTAREQEEQALAEQQRKVREALGLERAKLLMKQEVEGGPKPEVRGVSGGFVTIGPDGKVHFTRTDQPSGGAGSSGPGAPGEPGAFGTARSEGEKNKVSVAKDAIRNMPKWQEFINKNEDKFGFYAGRATKIRQSGALSPFGIEPDAATADFSAEVGRMSNDMLNALSGAAISPAEFERLREQIPQITDPPVKVKSKMAALDDYFKFRLQNYNAPYEGPGWQKNAAPASGAPQPGTVEDGYRFKGGDPADQKNWEPV